MELIIILGFSGVALDVGGVIYYDEPFELAWLQETFERMSRTEREITLPVFLEHVEQFYRHEGQANAWGGQPHRAALAGESWQVIRRAWKQLAQEIPHAVRAVRDMTERVGTVVVANQPPECADVLDRWGLTGLLRGVFLDSVEGVAKPDPGLLDLGRARLGLPPGELLMVGNRVDHDVRPALALGCGAVFVRGDSAYCPPPGVHRDLIATYERLRAVRTAPPHPRETIAIVSSLAELVDLAAGAAPGAPAARGGAHAPDRERGSGRS